MKIRKVKIQAFKSYLKEEDSTFDFSWLKDSSQVANLVSIYAPNGFGKTSFYDAVDYCYTKNITRYIRDDKTRVQNKKNATRQSFIVRNRNADNEIDQLDTKVRIETEDNIEFISPIIKHSHNGSDYKFDDANTPENRKYFRDLMLSQEAIDSFLRETNPVDRFKKFATKQVNDLSLLNAKRLTISQLSADIESNIREIKSKEQAKMCELVLIDTDKDILEKINHTINKCNQLGLELSLLSEVYDIPTHQNLKMSITEGIGKIDSDRSELDKKIKLINNFTYDIKKLYSSVEEMKVLNKDLEKLRSVLLDLNNIFKKNTLIKLYVGEKESLELKLTKANTFYLNNEQFYKLYNERKTLTQLKTKDSNNNNALINKTKASSNEIEKSRKTIALHIEQLEKHKELKDKAESLFLSIESGLKEKTVYNSELNELKNKKSSVKGKVVDCENIIRLLSNFNITSLFEPNSLVTNSADLNKLSNIFNKNNELIRNIDFKIKKHNSELEQLKSQESTVSQLISIGYELINKNESTDCPLCSQAYEDFDKLKFAIESNKVIDSLSDNILKQLSLLNEDKSKLNLQNNKLVVDHQLIISKQIDENLKVKQLAETELSLFQKAESDVKSKKRKLEADLDFLRTETLSMTKDGLQEHLSSKIQDVESDVSGNRLKINDLQDDLEKFCQNKTPLEKNIKYLHDEIDSIEQNELYRNFINYCDEQLIDINGGEKSTKDELKVLQDNISAKLNQLSSNIASEKTLKIELEPKIPNELASYSQIQVAELIEKNELSEIAIRERFSLYKELFKGETSYWLDLNKAQVEVNSALEDATSDLELAQQKQINLRLLSSLAEEASSLSEGIKLQNELNELEGSREGLTSLKNSMKEDVGLIDSEIKKYIDEYFYVDLINELYNAIDPHPEFKAIKFEYISNKNPELHIKVKGSSEGDTVAPALHFSSAQINVLSLSIFLAKALNTKSNDGQPANCIFIDDPVQSMDAINVLSIIDLLRNISVRFNKQLIISTHDENFHELLKKKMPSNLFKSKFLKLESFGKVAVDE
jgi:exonuclease SbcC